jgi:hypothetical protein
VNVDVDGHGIGSLGESCVVLAGAPFNWPALSRPPRLLGEAPREHDRKQPIVHEATSSAPTPLDRYWTGLMDC